MYRVIGGRGSGKTSQLMLLAKEQNASIACSNPSAMRKKAEAYGITGLNFISYSELFSKNHDKENIMIDEMENFVKHYIDCNLTGYTLTNED